jgi:hypothetical protein
MGQTSEGGKKAAQTTKLLYGSDFHSRSGSKGGSKKKGPTGFALLSKEERSARARQGAKKRWAKYRARNDVRGKSK